jgi:RHS repeat-associated protein
MSGAARSPCSRSSFRRRTFAPRRGTLAALVCLALTALTAPARAADGGPGQVPPSAVATDPDSGFTYPWEASHAGTNTGNGNKLTALPLVAWTARGGLPVNLTLYHNSQGSDALSEVGYRWTHGLDVYLVLDPSTLAATVRWGDGLGVAYEQDWYTGDYLAPTGIRDALGAAYDAHGFPTAFTLTSKAGVKYRFADPIGNRWRLAWYEDRSGNRVTLTHNASGYLTGVTDPSGRSLTFSYDSANALTSVSDPGGRVFSFSRSSGNLTGVTFPDPDGAGPLASPVVSVGYDANARITSLTDPRGGVSTFAYNADGSLAWAKDALNGQTTYAYTTTHTDITDPRGGVTRYAYSFGRLSSVRNALSQTTSYAYDADNNRTSVTDPAGKVWSYTYDSRGNVLTATDPLGHATTYTYNALDLPLTVTTHLGRVTTFTYDAGGNRLTEKNPLNQTTTYTYTAAGLVETVTTPLTHQSVFAYDAHGNLTSVTDATGRSATATFDLLGRKVSETAGGLTTGYAYDNLGRLTSVSAPGGRVTSFAYDANGNKTSATNSLSQTDTYVYDALNRVTGHTDALGRGVSFGYDANGNKTSFTDGRGKVTSYAYDLLDRNVSISYPDGTGESWTYNTCGLIATHADGRGVVTTNAYDDARRLTGVTYSVGASSVSFAYDADDRKTGMSDGTGATTYGYDAAGRLTARTSPQGSVSYGYDAAGRKTSETVNLGTPTTFTYDNAGRMLTSVAANGTTGYAYDSAGRLVTTAYPNGATEDRYYSPTTGDLSETWHRSGGGSVMLARFTHGYDGLGRKTSESQPSGVTVSFAYDAAGQLTGETRSGANAFVATYTYDNAGNRLTKTVGGVTESYSYDDANKLLAAGGKSYAYDLAGNVTGVTSGGVTTTVTWDGAGRMTGVSGGGLAVANASTYNGIGQHVGKTDSAGAASLTLADDAVDASVLSDGLATYQRGLDLISETRSGASKFFHLDSLGTARALSDSSGAKTDALETDAFGMTVSVVGTPVGARPFGFAARHGYQTDSDTGLQRLGHRFYDPSTGRFLSRDPIRAGYNWYAYCENDPVNAVDPEGLDAGWGRDDWPYADPYGYVPKGPPGVSLEDNANEVAGHPFDPWWFRDQVRTGGPWDFKSEGPNQINVHPEYENFGNYHYGYVGAAVYGLALLQAEAGRAQQGDHPDKDYGGDPGSVGFPEFGTPPYGDDANDQDWIRRGYEDYMRKHNVLWPFPGPPIR